MSPPDLLVFDQISKYYGSAGARVVALDHVDLTIRAGELCALIGPSGSGKSTCLNILGCLDQPSSGHYYFRGLDAGRLGHDQLALLRRHFLGFVFQSFNLLPRTSALENVELPLLYRGLAGRARRELAREALASVGLGGRFRHTPSELSGGEQQRVAIARALVTEPEVLLADEPTGNLDTRRSHEIMHLLAELNASRRLTIVMVTHEADMAAYARRVISFRDGRVVSDGAPTGMAKEMTI